MRAGAHAGEASEASSESPTAMGMVVGACSSRVLGCCVRGILCALSIARGSGAIVRARACAVRVCMRAGARAGEASGASSESSKAMGMVVEACSSRMLECCMSRDACAASGAGGAGVSLPTRVAAVRRAEQNRCIDSALCGLGVMLLGAGWCAGVRGVLVPSRVVGLHACGRWWWRSHAFSMRVRGGW